MPKTLPLVAPPDAPHLQPGYLPWPFIAVIGGILLSALLVGLLAPDRYDTEMVVVHSVAVLALFFLTWGWSYRRTTRAHGRVLDADAAGDKERARRELEVLAQSRWLVSEYRAWTLSTLGNLEMSAGDLERALALHSAAARVWGARRLHAWIVYELTVTHALSGHVDAAMTCLAELQRRAVDEATTLAAEGLVAARRARYADAVDVIGRALVKLRRVASHRYCCSVQVVHAYALSRIDGVGEAELDAALGGVDRDDDYSFLGRAWPEMDAFLGRVRLERGDRDAA